MSEHPRYIAVEGPIGVGKTSLAEMLAAELGARLVCEQPDENPFLAAFYRDPRRHAMSAQLFYLLQRYQQQGDLGQGDLFARGGIVSDYLFSKDRLFASLTLSEDELALYEPARPDDATDLGAGSGRLPASPDVRLAGTHSASGAAGRKADSHRLRRGGRPGVFRLLLSLRRRAPADRR